MMMQNLSIFLMPIFSSAVKNLEFCGFNESVILADDISHSILKIVLKCTNHPRTTAISSLKNTSIFSFSSVSVNDVIKEISKANPRMATQNTNIPV